MKFPTPTVLAAAAVGLIPAASLSTTIARAETPAVHGPPAATYDEVKAWIAAYKAAHRGRGGKDWDINAKSPAEIRAEPDTKRLLSICGPNQRPVIPHLAWEYGGSDHRWENPDTSALVYCVCTPVEKPTSGWRFDRSRNRVIADVYVKFPDQNPCKDETGKDQVLGCIGDSGNLEILVDTASLGDGNSVGLDLSEASTELRLILPNGKKVSLAVMK